MMPRNIKEAIPFWLACIMVGAAAGVIYLYLASRFQ